MVNLETCRMILNGGGYGKGISNDEIRNLIDFLYVIAQYQVEEEMNNSQIVVA